MFKRSEVPFDALTVLGNKVDENVRALTQPDHPTTQRALAAGEALKLGMAHNLILSGGYTNGRSHPSEAQLMYKFLAENDYLSQFNGQVKLEQASWSTHNQLQFIDRMAKANDWQRVGILTSSWHMRRVMLIAAKLDLRFAYLPAEAVLVDTNHMTTQQWRDELGSWKVQKRRFSEAIGRIELLIDPKARLSSWRSLKRLT